MVAVKFYICLWIVFCESKRSLVPQAIVQLVQSHYGGSSVKIEIFYNSNGIKIMDETVKLLSGVKELKVTKINTTEIDVTSITDQNGHHNYSNDAIFLFDTLENYLKFRAKIFIANPAHDIDIINFLVYCEDLSVKKIQEVITMDTLESFMIEKNSEISLHMMVMFTEKKCGDPQLIKINQFSISKRNWTTKNFISPTIDNFYGCEVWVGFWSDILSPFINVSISDDGIVSYEGIVFMMFETLATHLNFKFRYYDNSEKDRCDFVSAVYSFHEFFLLGQSLSDPIYSTSAVVAVPPGQLYSSWEKLWMPFDRTTWILLGVVFVLAFFIIILIKLSKSSSTYEFIIGSSVATPALNVVAIFMGIGQISLPQRIISRFMFMSFILFCLIMRTAYQGKYFEFLTSNMNKKPIATIEELKEKNFTLFNEPAGLAFHTSLDILQGFVHLICTNFCVDSHVGFFCSFKIEKLQLDIKEIMTGNGDTLYPVDLIFNQLQNSSFKGAAICNDYDFSMYNYKKQSIDQITFNKQEIPVISYNLGVRLPHQKSYLLPTFKRKINLLIQGGFFTHWIDSYLTHNSLIEKEIDDPRIVLSLDHLSVGFTVWLSFLIFALLALVAELAKFYFSNFIYAIVFQKLLKTFYKLKHNH